MPSHWFRNGTIYTLDARQPWAASLVVHDGVIAYVGDDDGAYAARLDNTVEIDLEGGFLMPGFIDGHDHLIGGALSKVGVSLEGLEGKDAVLAAIARYAREHPHSDVIRGHGWTPFTFGEGQQPHRTWLDTVTDVRPAMMHTYDVHDVWANTAAFLAAGIDADTPDPNPPLSYWPRDPDGFPSGTCCEPEAWVPIAVALGMFTVESVREAMSRTMTPAPSWGITTYFDATPIVNSMRLITDTYEHLMAQDAEGGLPVRIVGSHSVRDPQVSPERVIRMLREMNERFRSPNLAITTLKLFMDGVGPQHTAAMLEPYADQSHQGAFVMEPEVVQRYVEAANLAGFDVHIHACGDAGVRGALDAIEAVQTAHPQLAPRNTVCHLEFCHPDDAGRFAGLGVTMNGTPLWGTDYRGEFVDSYPTLVGAERFERDYCPYGDIVRSGALVTFGADCPGVEVHEIPPLVQIEAAVTRRRPGKPDDRPAGEHQRITLAEALRCYTLNGAIALRLEHLTGSLEVGKLADLVLLGANPFDVPEHEIHRTPVALTMLAGRITHDAR
jgi:predicted amidohydrolase YtcJ